MGAPPRECGVRAGVQVTRRADMMETTPESYDRVMGTNLRGPFFLTQAVARLWLAAPPAKHPPQLPISEPRPKGGGMRNGQT